MYIYMLYIACINNEIKLSNAFGEIVSVPVLTQSDGSLGIFLLLLDLRQWACSKGDCSVFAEMKSCFPDDFIFPFGTSE